MNDRPDTERPDPDLLWSEATDGEAADPSASDAPSTGDAKPGWLSGYAISITAVAVVLLIGLIAVLILRDSGGGDDDTPTTTEAAEKAWPSLVGGRPAIFGARDTPPPADAGDAEPGAYLWSDFDGWHLWIVRGDEVDGVKGTITIDAEPTRAAPATAGQGTVRIEDDVIHFDFTGVTAPVVGVDFNTYFGSRISVAVESLVGPLDASRLHTGGRATPATNPIVIVKE